MRLSFEGREEHDSLRETCESRSFAILGSHMKNGVLVLYCTVRRRRTIRCQMVVGCTTSVLQSSIDQIKVSDSRYSPMVNQNPGATPDPKGRLTGFGSYAPKSKQLPPTTHQPQPSTSLPRPQEPSSNDIFGPSPAVCCWLAPCVPAF